MNFTIFGKRILIVFPFQKYRQNEDWSGWYVWIMKYGQLILPPNSVIKIHGDFYMTNGGINMQSPNFEQLKK